MLERPELRGEAARGRLEQQRHVKMIGAEAHAMLAQRGAGILLQTLDVVATLARSSTPSDSDSWKARPRAMPVMPGASSSTSSAPR